MKPSKLSAQPSANNISIVLKPSRLHRAGFVLLAACLLLAIWHMQSGYMLLPIFLYYIYIHYQQHFGSQRIERAVCGSPALWTLNGQTGYALCSSSVRRYWAILYFKPRRVLAIFPDRLDKESFRRLRVLLRE